MFALTVVNIRAYFHVVSPSLNLCVLEIATDSLRNWRAER